MNNSVRKILLISDILNENGIIHILKNWLKN